MLDEWLKNIGGGKENGGAFIKSKKGRYIIIIVICVGLLALLWDPSPQVDSQSPQEMQQQFTGGNSVKEQLTCELKNILGQIEGAGYIKVSITVSSDGEKFYLSNVVEEKNDIAETDSQGGAKKSLEVKTTRELAVSSGNPLLIESKLPPITGVLIVAEGARDPAVKEKLLAATATLLNIPAHKISVMPGERSDSNDNEF